MFKKNVKRVASLLLVAVLIMSFAACGKIGSVSIDLGSYVTAEFTGINGRGKVDFDFDSEALAAHLIEKCSKQLNKIAKKNGSEFSDIEIADYAYMLADSFYVEGEGENLSNGDQVSARITFDGSLQTIKENYGIEFKTAVVTFTANNLKEPIQLDVFENMNVEFKGISPNLKVSFSEKEAGKYGFYVTYRINNSGYGSYKIGDTLNIVAQFDEAQAEEKGYMVTTKEKAVVIDQTMAESYVQTPEALTQDAKTIIRSETDKRAPQLLVKKDIWGNVHSDSITDLSFKKAYLAYGIDPQLNDGNWGTAYNFICMVYQYRGRDAEGNVNSNYTYEYLCLCNVRTKNGEIIYNVEEILDNGTEFASEEELKNYVTVNGYSLAEIQGF